MGGLEGRVGSAIEPRATGGDSDTFGFRDEAGVIRFEKVRLEDVSEAGDARLLVGKGGEVVHFVRIGFEVVEFFGGARGFPEVTLGSV